MTGMMYSKVSRAVVVVVSLGLFAGCSKQESDNTYVGYVEGEYVYVGSPQAGWLVHAPFVEGDSVSVGDILFELDKDLEKLMYEEASGRTAGSRAQLENLSTGARPAEIAALQARLEEAQAQLKLAQSDFDRKYPLVAQGIISEADGDALQANLDRMKAIVNASKEAISIAELSGRDALKQSAQASLNSTNSALLQAQWRLDERSVTSKVSGRVELVFRRTGEFLTMGTPVLAILPPENIKIRFFVPQDRVSSIHPGSLISIQADGMASPIQATISFIAGEAEFTPPVIYSTDARQKLVFMVEARAVSASELRPGLPVDVILQ